MSIYGKPHQDVIATLKNIYPVGTRVKLIYMDDAQAPDAGTLGTVRGVDGMGDLLMDWDNGSHLKVIFGQDIIIKMD